MPNVPSSDEPERRVVPLRKGMNAGLGQPVSGASPDADDLTRFQQADGPDDYRHRMLTNVAGLAVILLLIAAGVWIADTMASMQKNQDCVLSGRRGCTPVDAPPRQRW